jgi:hypothetical protein
MRSAFLLACVATGAVSQAGTVGESPIVRAIDQSQLDREARLAGYVVTEHYTIRNSRFAEPAEMTVTTTYTKGAGKVYHVESRSGPPFLQTHVLDRMLKEEAEMSRGQQRDRALVTSGNYQMKPTGQDVLDGRPCDLVELTPRVKSAHLLKGRAWVDAENHGLVRIEGKPPASPAFLAGKPDVVRDYSRVDGFSLATKSRATSESFLLGKTELTIEYTGYLVTTVEAK